MKNVYIISDFTPKLKTLANSLNIPDKQIISNEFHENERGFHDWISKIFNNNTIDILIIPISIPTDAPIINTDGLLIALHLRLNYEIEINKRLIPIIFLSNISIANIIEKNNFDVDNNPQNLVFTKGIYFSLFDAESIKECINKAIACKSDEYHQKVLNKLKVLRKETIGNHDIANAWGCYKLAQVIGLRENIFELESISKHLKQLYAKYLICQNEAFSQEKRIDLIPLKCSDKKILFIDDKSDEGWALIMMNIFKSAGEGFTFVDSSKYKNKDNNSFINYDGFYEECRSHIGKDWDLIIIDLRLNPEKEDIDNEMIAPKDFSGFKLIDEFLKENEGYQIIVSTASNKIWNINAALERGAVSYYIKESPEFNYSLSEINKHYSNFKDEVEKCFEKSYLKYIWDNTKKTKNYLNELKQRNIIDKDYLGAINTFLDLAFDSLKNQSGNYAFDSAFIYYFLILEASSKQIINEDNPILEGVIFKFEYRKTNIKLKYFDETKKNKTTSDLISKDRRIVYNQKFYNLIDYSQIKNINPVEIVNLRNKFSHPDLINNRRIAIIKKENIIELFEVCIRILNGLA